MMGHGGEATPTAMTQTSGAHKSFASGLVKQRRTEFVIGDAQMAQTMPPGVLSGALISCVESPLPPAVANVPKEDVRSFLHHKRVGNYLLGRTLGEGSFAKVKEGMHSLTGEKVTPRSVTDVADCTPEIPLAACVVGACADMHACTTTLCSTLRPASSVLYAGGIVLASHLSC